MGKKIMDIEIKVSGMHCESCEMLLGDSISEIAGVEKVKADSKKGTVTISYSDENFIDSVIGSVKAIIEKEGYKVVS